MIAAVTDLSGAITGAHRTWLDPNGERKAPVDTPRRAMGHLLGHAVRFDVAHDVLAVGEGIETMLSLRCVLPTMPMVAALSAAHLAAILFPATLRRLYVARDDDPAGDAAVASLTTATCPRSLSSPTGPGTPRRRRSGATTSCWRCCRSGFFTFREQASRTTSPTKPGSSAFQSGSSVRTAHERRLPPLPSDGNILYCYQRHRLWIYAIMPAVTIRNLSDETHRALKIRAAQHNRSTEAEMRAILEAAVRPEGRLRLGTALAEMSRKIGLSNADVEALEQTRDTKPAEPLHFE
jgi:plasmid stability protein